MECCQEIKRITIATGAIGCATFIIAAIILILAIRQTRFCVTTAPTNDRKLAPNLECEIKADRCQCVSEELQREMKNMQTKNQTKQTEINKDLMLCRFQDDKDVWEKEKDEMRLAVVKLEKEKDGMGLEIEKLKKEITNLKEEMKDQQRKIALEAEKQREKINKEVAARPSKQVSYCQERLSEVAAITAGHLKQFPDNTHLKQSQELVVHLWKPQFGKRTLNKILTDHGFHIDEEQLYSTKQ
ncbi:hypothetical protein FQN53_005400 [Emmonsiellopsis sp. PD_33]|nr:hypothetical protein FQN53_005400 [Emmonsiellopsis sp. PD_33]